MKNSKEKHSTEQLLLVLGSLTFPSFLKKKISKKNAVTLQPCENQESASS